MSRLSRILIGIIAFLLVVAVLVASLSVWAVRRSFPKTSGEISLTGLDGPVDIYRDEYGIPQIYAGTSHDLFFAEGYVHAQDRFWQMDFWRHISAGRLSELLGSGTIGQDKFLRTLGWERIAKQEYEDALPVDRANMQAYADGVNAYLAEHKGSALSFEYVILKAINAGYQVEPWQPYHALAWAKVMAWDLGGNMDDEISRAVLAKTLTAEQMSEIIPSYDSSHPVIVPGFQVTGAVGYRESQDMSLLRALNPAFESLSRQAASLDAYFGLKGGGIGSNNWVISGDLTATGKPLLANDPHLGEQMPAIWYEVGLHCTPKGPDCPYEVTGFSFAGAPGVIIGHNDRIAWGFTNVGPDVMDLYIEKINPDNPNQYEVNGKWVDMQVTQETIQVGGGDPVPLTVRYTRHGPIISDTYGDLENFNQKVGLDLPANYAISLKWTALSTNKMFSAVLGFDRAQNWDEFRNAARLFAVPSQNLVYADVDGNIGYQMPGEIPIRNAGHDGRTPVPGWTDDYEWQGFIPFEQLPHTFNPPQGYVVTANNAVVSPDYPYSISTSWDYGYRAQRIVNMIEGAPDLITVEYIQQMQGDDKDLNAADLVPVLLQIPLDDARLQQVRALLDNWDYQASMDSAPAALFESWWKHLLADTFNDQLPESERPAGSSRWVEVVGSLQSQPDSMWWDDTATPGVETRDDIFKRALTEAVDELEGLQGKDPAKWAWGALHTLTFHNTSLGESGIAPIEAIFNRGPFRTSGGASIVNATSWDAQEGYQVDSLPSMRMIVDLSDLSNSLSIITTGESGHAYHPHYVDMADLWRNIEYHPMLFEQGQIESAAKNHLRLVP